MGTFLSVPVTDVESEEGSSSDLGLAFGVSAMQGWRSGEFRKVHSIAPQRQYFEAIKTYTILVSLRDYV